MCRPSFGREDRFNALLNGGRFGGWGRGRDQILWFICKKIRQKWFQAEFNNCGQAPWSL